MKCIGTGVWGKACCDTGVIGLAMYTKYTLSKLQYLLNRYGVILQCFSIIGYVSHFLAQQKLLVSTLHELKIISVISHLVSHLISQRQGSLFDIKQMYFP